MAEPIYVLGIDGKKDDTTDICWAFRPSNVIRHKVFCFSAAFAISCFLFLNTAYAAGDFTQMSVYVVKILGALVIAGSALMAVFGGISYASAYSYKVFSEGDGPAMAKTKGQIVAAVLMVVIGIFPIGGAGEIAALISEISLP